MKKHFIKVLCLVCILVGMHHSVSAAELPAIPTGLTATPGYCNTGKIALSWNSISSASGIVEYSVIDNGGTVVYRGPSNIYIHANLLPGSSHSYTVSAINPNGNSGRSAPVTVLAPATCTGAESYISDVAQCTAFNAPYYAQIGEKFTASMTVKNMGNKSWTSASQYGLRSEYTSGVWGTDFITVPYTVPAGSSFSVSPTFTAPSTPGNYFFGWRMSRGTTKFPDISSVCGPYGTHKITVYDKPIMGSAPKATPGACGTGKIDISWNEGLGKPTSYELRDGSATIYSGSARSFSHMSLTPGSSHTYTVRAYNQYGVSSWSGSAKVTAPNTCSGTSTPTPTTNTELNNPISSTQPIPSGSVTPIVNPNGIPSVPKNLLVKPDLCNVGNVRISWDATPGATAYTLRDGNAVIVISGLNSYLHTGLIAGSGHSYSVNAMNVNGSSIFASPVIGIVPSRSDCRIPNSTSTVTNQPPSYTNVTPSYYNSPSTGGINSMTSAQRDQLIATLRQLIQLLQAQLNLLN